MSVYAKLPHYLLLTLPGAILLLTSCATDQQTARAPKFKEEAAADFVVRYASDSTVYRIKPVAREGAFYRIFSRDELCETDASRVGGRDLAVVLIGYYWSPELDAQARQGWLDNLAKLNYRRAVILRSGDSDQVNGLVVLEDRLVGPVVSISGESKSGGAAPAQLSAR